MNLNRVLFWIHLIARAILDVLNVLDNDPGDGEESVGDTPPGFKPERIQVWIGIFARAALEAVEGVGAPPPEASVAEAAGVAREGRPVLVDVNIDYSRKTYFTQGVVKTNLLRLPFRDQARFVGRALKRKLMG